MKRKAILIDAIGGPERTVRIQVCERCAQPIIMQKQKAMDELVALLAELVVKKYVEKPRQEAKAKRARIWLTQLPTEWLQISSAV